DYSPFINKKPFKAWSIDLPEKNDYLQHSTEIKIDGLHLGQYAILLSTSPDFDKSSQTSLSFLNISQLACIVQTPLVGQSVAYIVNRESGEPIEGATVNLYKQEYNYKSRQYERKLISTKTSDRNGKISFQSDNRYDNFYLEIIKANDQLYLNDYINIYNRPAESKVQQIRTFIFTDRSIYRPEQTIYFKGIVLQTNPSDKKQVLANFKTKIILKDANYNEVQKLDVVTNEYGSFTGSFKAPVGLLNGMFTLSTPNGSQTIQIEEYKRPKFEVSFDTITASYKLNETIQIKGKAIAYAGNAIDGAQVSYRVYRNARFPYYWCYYRWGLPQSPQKEITHGKTTTSADGSFAISFDALADENVDKKTMPVFNYTIEADITDLNGETRSGSQTVAVSYQNLILNIETPQTSNIDNFNQIKVYASNLNGAVLASDIDLSLKKLKSPQQVLRTRLWEKPEYYSISENDYRKYFPLDEYNDENNYLNWEEEKTIWTQRFKSNDKNAQAISKPNEDAWYVLEAKTIDKDKNQIVEKKYIRLYKDNGTALPDEKLLIKTSKEKVEPEENTDLQILTPYSKTYMIYECNQASQTINEHWIEPKKTFSETKNIKETDRGGFSVVCWYVKDNRFYSETKLIHVPWSNKDLNISLQTFRDKIEPGSQQEWTIKISGNKKEKVSAELLASMYDASLDAFKKHEWKPFSIYTTNSSSNTWHSYSNFSVQNSRVIFTPPYQSFPYYEKKYPTLETWGFTDSYTFSMAYRSRGGVSDFAPIQELTYFDDGRMPPTPSPAPAGMALEKATPNAIPQSQQNEDKSIEDSVSQAPEKNEPMVRSNLAETAFFFPQLQTDAEGNILLKFKAPEALTKWKLMAFAHTKNLQSAYITANVHTQKELMIVPNTPRFLREGDEMMYSAKITNLSDKELNVLTILKLQDALNNESVDALFQNNDKVSLLIPAGESKQVIWKIKIPSTYTNPIRITTIAQAKGISDGEENVVPLVLNSMLVTETLPLPVKPNMVKKFQLENLLKSKNSNTIKNYHFAIEYTPNPAWYAIQSLPYLTDYPYECAEQTFNRYYANALAAHIANSNPKIKEIFSTWKEKDTTALLSNLSKNEELKSALLQETPWVLEAKNENEQKRAIATLFNLNRMSKELTRAVRELELKQTINGGFVWFKGMPEDRFMTQYIITGVGRLLHIGIDEVSNDAKIQAMVQKAIPYLDLQIKKDYDELLRLKVDLSKQGIGSYQIQYLYMRSFFKNIPIHQEVKTAFDFYLKKCAAHWTTQSNYLQAMSGLALDRWNDKNNAMNIVKALRENAIHNEEMGMYWKQTNSYWWYEAPIETQSLMIELFKEVAKSEDEVDELKIWLLKNKQTNNWKTTKATADACYALLLNGTYWLAAEPQVNIKLGENVIDMSQGNKEAGTAYQKINFDAAQIKPDFGDIEVQVKSDKSIGTTWGAAYWQYFEQLDKINNSETGLKLNKQLYKINHSDKGEFLSPIDNSTPLHVGDKVKVRIELRVDRPYEYVHLKDMRAACFEPLNVISHYQYQGGLGYYESTKDLATHFFFHYLQKGVYVFEYPLFVTNKGNFSNGISSIQCMYAPEFSSHSEGIRVKVE
ncbi:MAG: alpha-2-macroglobulin, partial [Bacteroidia bacterium]|nr:alpha-2-macroglobulin [Bacteroidia bacterium]